MKKFLVIYVSICILFLVASLKSMGASKSDIEITAQRVDKHLYKNTFDDKVLQKYIPIQLTIKNKGDKPFSFSNRVLYVFKDKSYLVPNSQAVYEKTKIRSIKRTVLVTVPVTVVTIGILTFPTLAAMLTYCTTTNDKLESNIKKNNFKAYTVFEGEIYKSYVLIPVKDKKASSLIFSDISYDDENYFDITVPILSNNL